MKHMEKEWVARSNDHAQLLLELRGRFSPEGASALGLTSFDCEVIDLKPELLHRMQEAYAGAAAELDRRLLAETDPAVRQDLQILLHEARMRVKGLGLSEKYEIPFINIAEVVFEGLRVLLDPQTDQQRGDAALVRLRRYAGLEDGYSPIAALAEEHTRTAMTLPGTVGPFRGEIEKGLSRTQFFIDGISPLFRERGVRDYEQPLELLSRQIAAYGDFVRRDLLPRAREDYRLPPELYAYYMQDFGVDIEPLELARQAREAFDQLREEMVRLAPEVAAARGFASSDYRDVIRALRAEQLPPDRVLEVYRQREREIAEIIRREDLATLPAVPMIIRLATPAEAAVVSAPHMRPPRLIGNTGERGEFVLPVAIPTEDGKGMRRLTDFSFDTISWMLTAHEGRPGHEMQFASMIERGVSTARAVFAFNSVNAEGWALYCETIIQPFMPLPSRFMTYQFELLRAARAFLDPELQAGVITPEEAMRILMEEVVITEDFAREEVDRYTFFLPGQATSYFYGYTKLRRLREETENLLAGRFSARKFHDFILSQGLVPPDLLRKAVLEEFVPAILAEPGREISRPGQANELQLAVDPGN